MDSDATAEARDVVHDLRRAAAGVESKRQRAGGASAASRGYLVDDDMRRADVAAESRVHAGTRTDSAARTERLRAPAFAPGARARGEGVCGGAVPF